METFGSPAKTWQAATDEIRVVLIDGARRQETLAYSELVQKITALDLQAHAPRLDELLGHISTEGIGRGHGMLSVLVVPRVLKTSGSELAPACLPLI